MIQVITFCTYGKVPSLVSYVYRVPVWDEGALRYVHVHIRDILPLLRGYPN